MLSRIFPKQIDTDYRGLKFAIWVLVLFLLIKTFASVNAIGLNPLWTNREVLQSVERVPLDTVAMPVQSPETCVTCVERIAALDHASVAG